MRKIFATTLAELAEHDERIVLLTGDLGYMALEPFADKFPDRFFNVGVAEQNMVGMATGMAEAGLIPWVYSIVPFAVLRPFEFIRNGPIQHHLPVRIVGVGGGVEYSQNGLSHYGLEDIGLLRTQPNLTLIVPSDNAQARTALLQTWNRPGPVYYRLGKDEKLTMQGLDGRFEMQRCQRVGDGNDVLFIATGTIAVEVVAAVRDLQQQGVTASIAVVSTFNPSPTEDLTKLLRKFSTVISVETHYINGGLGSLVAETIAENQINCRLIRCGFREMPDGITGSQSFMHERYELSAQCLTRTALVALEKVSTL